MLTGESVAAYMPNPGENVLCGVSGGRDSMVLLHLLWTWTRDRGGGVTAAHYNHHLRPTASRDEAFVRGWCAERGVAFVSGGGDVNAYAACEGLSAEEAARTLRYAFLRREAASRRIYVAHHADDNAETILWNLIRGAGLRGLSGMRHERDGIVRPLLDVPRRELEAYAAFHGVAYVEDETNADPDAAARNRLRLEVMPLLRRLNPKADAHIREAGGRAALLYASMEADARRYMERVEARDGFAAIPCRDLSHAPTEARPFVAAALLDRMGAGRKDIGAVHLRAIANLADGGDGKRVDLPHGVAASVRDGWLVLRTRTAADGERELSPGIPVRWGAYELTLTDIPDGDGLSIRRARAGEAGRVTARACPAGERLRLPGTNGARTVKRLCVDRRISLDERDALPAIYVDGRLAAVWRLGTDAAFTPDADGGPFIRVRTLPAPAEHPFCGK